MTATFAPPPTERSRVRRAEDRGHYDHATIHAIVDAAYLCHVSFVDERGPLCLPTAVWRVDDHVLIHGSNGSKMMKSLAQGTSACVAITHLDGLVMARSAFSHSMNFRSVVIHGAFEPVPDDDKTEVMHRLMDHLAPGRRHEARAPDRNELAATTVLRMPLFEAAAKIRAWGPKDKDEDLNWPVWAGVLPLTQTRLAPQAEANIPPTIPDYVHAWADR
jgi:nitroimidazol reductase NimA-like FMN-containing flavoprotein (pyridoxamine 5'-phosphate oxidase superfamily)